MDKKTATITSKDTIFKLKDLAKKKESIGSKLAVTAKELKESYEILEKVKANDEAILESIGDAVMVCRKDGRVVLFNVAAEIISGFSSKEAIGRHYSRSLKFITEKKGAMTDFIVRAIETGQKTKMEGDALLVRKDGSKIPVADSATPVKNLQGRTIGCVVVFRDISQEQILEHAKDELVSLASHELRTPMTAIAGFVDMILEGSYGQVTKEIKEPLGYIAESTDRLIRMVNDFLNVSRIEAGRMKFILGSVELGAVVSKVVTGLEPVALERHLELIFDKKEAVQVQADTEKLEQILHNMIGNALKFTDKGNVSIVIRKNGDDGKIEITDTGVGIPAQGQHKLFGKFEQINTDSAGRPPGTGLGLYLSRQMAKKMGGDIKLIASALGQGSRFEISLPIVGSIKAKQILTEIKAENII